MMESREAAPERSSLDAEQFNVRLVIIIIITISSPNISPLPPDGRILSEIAVFSSSPPRP